ncbi:MAG: MerR family transcriptional regulator [Sphingopyxis sp.]
MTQASKAPDALRTIGEVSADTGIAMHILRYWDRNVADLKPLRRAGRRYYRPQDVAIVRRLHDLVSLHGYTLEGATRALHSDSEPLFTPQPASDTLGPVSAPDAAVLRRLRSRLQAALDAA